MVAQLPSPEQKTIIYPDSDGELIADDTQQFDLIVWIKHNIERLFANDPNVFVAGDLLWYPVEGDNRTRQAPDVMVVFGRPKGYRGSYQQWLENNIAPQVVFEIWSPGNRLTPMARKLNFYDRYGVEEYYLYKPDAVDLAGWLRCEGRLEAIAEMNGWVSPRLGARFEIAESALQIYRPDDRPFLTYLELAQLQEQAEQRAQESEQRAQQLQAELEQQRLRSQALEARLREMGIDPEKL